MEENKMWAAEAAEDPWEAAGLPDPGETAEDPTEEDPAAEEDRPAAGDGDGVPAPGGETRHLDETRVVDREEVIRLAQKGMDYDRIRTQLDSRTGREAQAYGLLEQLAGEQGVSVEDFLDETRAARLAQREHIEMAAALGRVRLERREAELARQSQQAAAEKRQQDIRAFRQAFPGVEAGDIPPEVWTDVARGMSLTAAYARQENARLRAELERLRQGGENRRRAAGSRASAGNRPVPDAYAAAWYAED